MTPEVALACSSLLTILATIVLAFLGWRVKNSQLTQIETLKSDLDRRLHIQKTTFDDKYSILSELWTASVNLRDSAIAIRPLIGPPSFLSDEAPNADLWKQRFMQFEKCLSTFSAVREKNRPFYPETIYEILGNFSLDALTLAMHAAEQYSNAETTSEDWSKLLAEMDEIGTFTERVCQATRKELAT